MLEDSITSPRVSGLDSGEDGQAHISAQMRRCGPTQPDVKQAAQSQVRRSRTHTDGGLISLDNRNGWKTAVVQDADDVAALRPAWEAMLAREPKPMLMADLDRYLTVIGAGGEGAKPHVMIIEKAGCAEALVIARVEPCRLPCRLGYLTMLSPPVRRLSIVHGGILGQPSRTVCEVVLDAISRELDDKLADVAFFNHLPTDSNMFAVIQDKCPILTRAGSVTLEEHWQTSIPDTPDQLKARFSKKRRNEWNRLGRRLEEAAGGKLSVRCATAKGDIADFVSIAARITAATYKDRLNVGFQDTPLTRSLLAQAAEAGRWRGYLMYAGDVPCAFESGTVFRRCFFAETSGYDPTYSRFSPGTLIWIRMLKGFIEDPAVRVIDYGFGGAQYKERFGTDHWVEASPYIFSRRLYPRLVGAVHTSVGTANVGMQRVAAKMGVVAWIKRRWRRRLQSKARKNTDSPT